MTKNSARKKAARAYQAAHPGTTFPEAMRAVARGEDPTSAADSAAQPQPFRAGVDPQVRDQVIAALTALARSVREDGSAIDFADELARILASVTANVGSVEKLLIGRPGSWEAGLVAQLVNGTVMEEDLPRWRTVPVRVVLDLDDYWYYAGLEQVYDEDIDALERLRSEDVGDPARDQSLVDEIDAIDELVDQDRRSYIEAWTGHAREAALELGIEVPITVVVGEDTRSYEDLDSVTDHIERRARERTPHPVVPELGELVRRRNHSPEDLAGRIRAAGRSYRERVADR
ncbi:hypothetical protein [Rhodococcus sp. NPDC047139]|uniref:hypothetical protein n=1 Tax=Rhodococcus sp. NPDC047139 TaxID=3155141 RepID=UPI003408D9FD